MSVLGRGFDQLSQFHKMAKSWMVIRKSLTSVWLYYLSLINSSEARQTISYSTILSEYCMDKVKHCHIYWTAISNYSDAD